MIIKQSVDGRKIEGGIQLILHDIKQVPSLFSCNIDISDIRPREKRKYMKPTCPTQN